MQKLVLLRHGQSQWNLENRFTGWVDVPLTEKGIAEAKSAGQKLKESKIIFTKAYTSYLQRAIRTLWMVLEESDQMWLPVEKHWRLNERHYGGLQGLNKQETRDKFGDDQVFQWRRSYATPPPEASGEIQEKMEKARRYSELGDDLPKAEALKQCLERVEPYWNQIILPQLKQGGDILITAHGNSLRALIKLLTNISEEEITQFEFSTGVPLVCDLDDQFMIQKQEWLK